MSQLKLLMSEAVGGGSCFTGLICNQNLPHSCKHDEPEPDCRLAVNSNLQESSCSFHLNAVLYMRLTVLTGTKRYAMSDTENKNTEVIRT